MRVPRLQLNKKRLKYGNVITERDGIKFRSKGEADRYSELKLLQHARKIANLKLQVKFKLLAYGEVVGSYIADFVYLEGDNLIIEDYKGTRTALFTLKWNILKAMTKHNPKIVLRLTGKSNK